MNSRLVRKHFTADSVSWTPIIAPIDCNGIIIKNLDDADVKLRSDAADPATEDTLPTGFTEAIVMTAAHQRSDPRFESGDVVSYVQATDLTADFVVTFIF